jgi:uncharacterized membrane protein
LHIDLLNDAWNNEAEDYLKKKWRIAVEYLLSFLIGISLSATSGFRVFVPLLVVSIAALAGWIELTPTFAWLGSYPALATLAVAALLELVAYLFPYVDNLLSTIAVPVSLVAGTLITAAVLVDFPPFLAWALAIIAGGGAALGGSTLSNAVHAGSTVTTAGAANPVISFFESLFSLLMSFLAVLLPLIAFLGFVFLIWLLYKCFSNARISGHQAT